MTCVRSAVLSCGLDQWSLVGDQWSLVGDQRSDISGRWSVILTNMTTSAAQIDEASRVCGYRDVWTEGPRHGYDLIAARYTGCEVLYSELLQFFE